MARNFNGSSAYLEAASAVVTAEPLTMACWFLPYDVTSSYILMSVAEFASFSRHQLTCSGATAGDPVRVASVNSTGATSGVAATTTGYTSGIWHHACGVFASSSSRSVYLNGASSATDTAAVTVGSLNRTAIGTGRYNSTTNSPFLGCVAEVAFWNIALNAVEVAQLARGFSPSSIRPQNLVFYNPLDDRWTYDRARGLYLTDVGPTGAAEDPPILRKPRRKYFLFSETAAPASVIFRNRTGSRARLIA